jgi:hypothetical protein
MPGSGLFRVARGHVTKYPSMLGLGAHARTVSRHSLFKGFQGKLEVHRQAGSDRAIRRVVWFLPEFPLSSQGWLQGRSALFLPIRDPARVR